LKILRQFVEQQGPAVAQISAALTQGHAALAERLAHTLKGVAGNIGAKSVQAGAGTLEKLIRSHATTEEVESAKQKVAADLDPLIARLQLALSSPTHQTVPQASAPAAVDPAQSRAAAEELRKLLAEFDPGAVDFIEANQGLLRALFTAGIWEELRKQAQAYAFQECETLVEQAVRNSLGGL
jgi:two-component system sensor histidine kinase/response regulator